MRALLILLLTAVLPKGLPLRHATRQQIHETASKKPGISLRDLSRHLGLPRGTLRYHLFILELAGMIKTKRIGRRVVIIPTDEVSLEIVGLITEPTARLVGQYFAEHPDSGIRDCMDATRVSQRVAYYHVKRFVVGGLLVASRDGYARLLPTPKLYIALGL